MLLTSARARRSRAPACYTIHMHPELTTAAAEAEMYMDHVHTRHLAGTNVYSRVSIHPVTDKGLGDDPYSEAPAAGDAPAQPAAGVADNFSASIILQVSARSMFVFKTFGHMGC